MLAQALPLERSSDVIRSLALDAEGILRVGTEAPTEEIPRRLVRFWDSPSPPPDVAELLATWAPFHPGYEILTFNDMSARAFVAKHYDRRYVDAFDMTNHPAMRSDLFRLAYLFRCGGIYMDADERCFQSVEELRRKAGSLAVRRMEDNGLTYLNNTPIFAAPGLPFVKEWLDRVVDAVLASRDGKLRIWLATGPGILSRVFAQRVVLDQAYPMRVLIINDWASFSWMVFCDYKYTGRHWLLHDSRGWANAKLRAQFFKPRLLRALKRSPLARQAWNAYKSLRGGPLP